MISEIYNSQKSQFSNMEIFYLLYTIHTYIYLTLNVSLNIQKNSSFRRKSEKSMKHE